jgi:two-component system sensor histidine kinase KdpD
MEQRLHRVNGALHQRRVEMQEFLSIMAHDMKHPVVGIRGLLTLVLQSQPALDAAYRENIELCVTECDRMHNLLDRLTDLARIQRMQIHTRTVRLRPFPQQQIEVFRARLTQAQAHVEVRCDDTEVQIPADLVAQAFVNLIDNALKYACVKPGCAIYVEGRCDDDGLEIAVVDEGPGVAAGVRNAIFKPFRRGPTGPDMPAGSGIGLAAVRSLLRRVHGDVFLDPNTARGARFVLWIPRHDEADWGGMEDQSECHDGL